MSLTNPTVHLPAPGVSIPSWVRRHLSWMLIGLAVLATAAVLMVTLVDSDSDTSPVTPTLIERGSINAIDHRTTSSPAGTAQHDSISAIDHRAADPTG